MTYGSGCIIQVWDINTLNNKCILTSNEGNSLIAKELADPHLTSPKDICSCAVSQNNVVLGGTREGKLHNYLVWRKFQIS